MSQSGGGGRFPTQQELKRMASVAMFQSRDEQDQKFIRFEKYIKTYLPQLIKVGNPDALKKLKETFMKYECDDKQRCKNKDCLFVHPWTPQQSRQRMKRAFKQYVDKKFTFPDPTEQDFGKLLQFAEKRNDKSLEEFLSYLKKNKCSRTISSHQKDTVIDNRCSYRHPLEDDKRISEFRSAFRDYVNSQVPTEIELKNLLDFGRSRYGDDLITILSNVKQGKCGNKDHIDEKTNKQPINNSCFFRHPFETDERIFTLRTELYQYYLKNAQIWKRKTTRSRGGSGSQREIPRRSRSTVSRSSQRDDSSRNRITSS